MMRGVPLEEVDDGIFSCLAPAQRHSDYDSKVRAYDLLVGNRYYNRLVWGNWPSRYRAWPSRFAARVCGAQSTSIVA